MAAAAAGDNDSAGETLDTQLLGTDLKIVRGMIVRGGEITDRADWPPQPGEEGRRQARRSHRTSVTRFLKWSKLSEKKITSAEPAHIFVFLHLFCPFIDAVPQKCPKSTTSDARRPPGEKCRKWWNYRLIRSLQEATFYTHNIIGNRGFHFTSYSSHFVTSTSRHIH